MTAGHDNCASAEQAAMWHLGEMKDDDSRRFEAHIDTCSVCRAEVAALRGAANELALSGPEADPPADLLTRVLQRVRDESRNETRSESSFMPWNLWADNPESAAPIFAWDGDGVWESTPIPGIEARRLFVDRQADRVTMLVRMAPGTAFPSHGHTGPEECYVVQGDLHIGADTMKAGDFQYAPPGSFHPVQSTEGGCVLLLSSSLSDERR